MSRYIDFLFRLVDNSALVLFRVCFGFLCTAETWGAIATGWVFETFVEPEFSFCFIGFEWLGILHGELMYYWFVAMGALGIAIMLGYRYTLSCLLFCLMWSVAYLMQKSNYNNHYYLLILMSAAMAIVPAQGFFSLDVRWNRLRQRLYCRNWHILLFIVQLCIVYTYASIAKWNPDWIAGKPMMGWLSQKSDYWLIGPLLAKEWLQWTVVYGGIFFDLLICPLLLFRPTRKFAFVAAIGFHLFNSAVFQIGIFPYLMIAACLLFFPGEQIGAIFFKNRKQLQSQAESERAEVSVPPKTSNLIASTLAVYCIIQIALPLRHHLYEGNVNWTEEGHRMSWRMMLRAKSGTLRFEVKERNTDRKWHVNPSEFVTPNQRSALAKRPDMIWQFAQFLADHYANEGTEVEIYAKSNLSLNGRRRKPLIDPKTDLASVDWKHFSHNEWILTTYE